MKKEQALLDLSNRTVTIPNLPKDLLSDKEFVLEAFKVVAEVYKKWWTLDRHTLEFVSNALKDDEEVVDLAMVVGGLTQVQYASDRLRADKDFMLKVARSKVEGSSRIDFSYGYYYASKTLQHDPDFAKEVFSISGGALDDAPRHFKNNDELVKVALSSNPHAILYASQRFREDRELVKTAIKKSPSLIGDFKGWNEDHEYVILALENSGNCYTHVEPNLFNDRNFVMKLYKKGMLGRYSYSLGKDLKKDHAFLLRVGLLEQYEAVLLGEDDE